MDGKRDFADYYADMRLWNFGHVEPGLLPDGTRLRRVLCRRRAVAERPLGAVGSLASNLTPIPYGSVGVVGVWERPHPHTLTLPWARGEVL